jgi:hypothetical protein
MEMDGVTIKGDDVRGDVLQDHLERNRSLSTARRRCVKSDAHDLNHLLNLSLRIGQNLPGRTQGGSKKRNGLRNHCDSEYITVILLAGTVSLDMCCTCLYAESMSKMIQVRDVPEQIHGTLKARAAQEGMSLSDYIKRELEHLAERPTMREWLELTQRAKPIQAKGSAAQIVRELRDSR